MKQTIDSGIYIVNKAQQFWNYIKGIFNTGLDKDMERSTMDAKESTDKYATDKYAAAKAQYKVEPSEDIKEPVMASMTKGKFFEADIKIIIKATKDKDPKTVNWEELSITLNRTITSLKAKAKKLQK